MKKKRVGFKFAAKLVIIAAIVLAMGTTTLSYALIDETNSVHINASEIEDATLIIGTHLIYLGSMNDQIYEAAMKSAEESNQYNRYYKSEIAGGTWYDITEAGALADITTAGIVVEDRVIEALFMTHHTKSDGITYDLTNKSAIGIFDINDPYDLSKMDELEPIKLQYDVLVQAEEPSETMERDILYIKEIYKFDRRTAKTNEIDAQLRALQDYYNILVRDGAEEAMSDMVMSVMEKLDAARRVEVLGLLNDYQLQKMSQVIAREFTYLKGEITGTYTIAEERQKKAEEAAKEARQEVFNKARKEMNALQEELNKLKAEIEATAQQAYNKVIYESGYTPNGEIPEDIIAKAKAAYDYELNNHKRTERENLENQINDLKSNVDKRASKAAEEAAEVVLNAKRDVVEDYVLNSDLLTAVENSMTNVQESYMNYSSKMLEEGTGILSKAEYRFSMELIRNAQGGNHSGCDDAVKKLLYLQRISNSVIREETEERNFIDTELLGEAEKNYSSSVGSGAGETYRTLASTAAAATKKNVLNNQLTETEIVRNELQFIIQAYIDRMAPEKAMDYIQRCIDNVENYRTAVKADAYESYAKTSVDSYQEWLTRTLKNLQDLTGGSALDDLRLQKNELQTELMTALDKNRLDEAKKIETKIEAVDMEIKETEDYLNSVLESEYASESEKALAAAGLGDGSTLAALKEMKDSAVEDIKNGNLDGIENALDGIGALASAQPGGAMEALKDIYEELSNQELMNGESSQLDELMNQVEEMAMDQIDSVSDGLSEDALASLILAFFNIDGNPEDVVDSLAEEEMVIVLVGLSRYSEQYNANAAREVLKIYSKAAFNHGNKYIYEQLQNERFEYVPTDKLAQIINYRYIFNDSQKAVTLQKGSHYYQFEAFSTVAAKGTEEKEMSNAAGFQGVIYIPEDITQEFFTVSAEYLDRTTYGAMLTEELNNRALEFFDYLIEAEGGV